MEIISKDSKILPLPYSLEIKPNQFKNERDELVQQITDSINLLRVGTKYPPITKKEVALRLNSNPKLAKHENNGEVRYILNECNKRRTFSWFFYICPLNKRK